MLRKPISFVSQNVFLFNETIKNNILYSRPSATEEELIEATKLSGAYEFIKELPDGFETLVGEGGKTLSGGERKKLSIARAILKDSDIIIFDEATSELDPESEGRIERLIKERFKEKTCIVISHKPFTNNFFERVFFLSEGLIKNIGSFS
ncbi:MAG: ATP-binding cassette domain-containing protein [Candidatus Micrarchaeia archaeon]